MAKIIGIGHQDFTELITSGCFYVDKTEFIREWWENQKDKKEADAPNSLFSDVSFHVHFLIQFSDEYKCASE